MQDQPTQPITPSPYPQPQQPAPMMPQAPVPVQPTGGKKPWVLIVVIAIVVVVLGIGVAAFIFLPKILSPTQTGDATLPSATGLTADKVAKLDKRATFLEYFKNASTQQKLVTTHEEYRTDKPTDKPTSLDFTKIGFDYVSKTITKAADSVDSELVYQGKPYRTKMRCYGGHEYFKTGTSGAQWLDETEPDTNTSGPCSLSSIMYDLTEGVNAGGLSAAQADTFVSFLAKKEGLINVTKLQLDNHRNKQYLHYSVDITPIPTLGSYGGNYWLGVAFDETGLSQDTHPYAYRGVIGGGTHLEYYVDPATKLPVYSESTGLPLKDKNGKDQAPDGYELLKTVYTFGSATFAVETTNNDDLSLDW